MYEGTTLVRQQATATRSLTTGVPRIVADAGPDAAQRFVEFFTATIRNANTREAYARAVRGFLDWCEGRGLMHLDQIEPIAVATYVEGLQAAKSASSTSQRSGCSSTGW